MARARSLKPAIFKNELLGQRDPILTVLFAGLWCLADREGYLEDRPARIKVEILPYREGIDINGYLTELHTLGFIRRFTGSNSTPLIHVTKFLIHQNPHKTERPSDLVSLDNGDSCEIHVKDTLDNGSRPADSLVLTPSSPTPDPLPISPSAQRKKSQPPLEDLAFFTKHVWTKWPTRLRDGKIMNKGHKPEALSRCLAIKQKWGIEWVELELAVKRYHDFPNVKAGHVQAVEVFFGDRGHWLECWEWVKRQQQASLEM